MHLLDSNKMSIERIKPTTPTLRGIRGIATHYNFIRRSQGNTNKPMLAFVYFIFLLSHRLNESSSIDVESNFVLSLFLVVLLSHRATFVSV